MAIQADITERWCAAAEQKKAKEEAEAANRAKFIEDAAEKGELEKARSGTKEIEHEFDLAHAALERAVFQLKE
ncbi:MAG: hypothetical protein CMO80_12330 [Verrucomicrobiales bacterium]|nr:hypothetical protein [Verrucomicrobiales bacterium]